MANKTYDYNLLCMYYAENFLVFVVIIVVVLLLLLIWTHKE